MKAVTLQFKLTEEEYLDVSRAFAFRSAESKVRAALFFLLLTAGVSLLLLASEFSLPEAVALGAASGAGLFGVWRVRLRAALLRFYRGDPKFRDPVTLAFTDEGIAAKTREIDSKLGWGLYSEVFETACCYVLVYGKDVRMMTAVPKRAFSGGEQERAFRDLLSSHLRGKLKLRPAEGDAIRREYQPSSLEPPDWR